MEDQLTASLFPYLVGMLIGLVIGFERERAHQPETQAYGLRTFAFFGLLGAFAGMSEAAGSRAMAILATVFVILSVIMGYRRSSKKTGDIGLTTEASAMVVFILGFMAATDMATSFVLGALTLGLLAGKSFLHSFSRETITQKETNAFIMLIVIGVGILPFLSPEALDSWGIFVPRKLGTLIFILALVQFASYALLKIFGPRVGRVLGGFLAGTASSTAAFVNIREQLESEKAGAGSDLIIYGTMAILASLLQSAVIVYATSSQLFEKLLWSFLGVGLCCLALVVLVFWRLPVALNSDQGPAEDPLNLRKQTRFALVLFFVMGVTALAKNLLGPTALMAVGFVSGLFELQGVTFALSSVAFSTEVLWAMALAFVASLVSKAFMILSASNTGRRPKLVVVAGLGLLAAVFVAPLVW